MAAKNSLTQIQIDEDVLTCVVCLEIFTNPKVLPCHHSFCQECLRQLVGAETKLECPTCRCESQLPEGGVASLKPSFFINNILESLAKQTANTSGFCDTCQGSDPINRCVDCDLRICGVCTNAHRKIPATREHRVIPDDISQSYMHELSGSGLCKTHTSQKLEFYCEQCRVAVCCECVLTGHRPPQHRRASLTDTARQCREKLHKYIAQMKRKQTEIHASRVNAEEIAESAERQYEREVGKIKTQVQTAIENLFAEEKKLLTDLKEMYDGIKDMGHRQASAFRSMEQLITSTLTAVELLELQDNPVNVISAFQETEDSMNYLRTVDTKPELNPDLFPTFTPSDVRFTGRIGSLMSRPETGNTRVGSATFRSEVRTEESARQTDQQRDDLTEQYRKRKKEQLREQQRRSPQPEPLPQMIMRQIQLYQYQRQKQKKQEQKK